MFIDILNKVKAILKQTRYVITTSIALLLYGYVKNGHLNNILINILLFVMSYAITYYIINFFGITYIITRYTKKAYLKYIYQFLTLVIFAVILNKVSFIYSWIYIGIIYPVDKYIYNYV